jgi:hypothetical protein
VTTANDNETLDHLLSVVERFVQCRGTTPVLEARPAR